MNTKPRILPDLFIATFGPGYYVPSRDGYHEKTLSTAADVQSTNRRLSDKIS